MNMKKSATLALSAPAPSPATLYLDEIFRDFEFSNHIDAKVWAAYIEYLSIVAVDQRQKGRLPSTLFESFYVPQSRSHCELRARQGAGSSRCRDKRPARVGYLHSHQSRALATSAR